MKCCSFSQLSSPHADVAFVLSNGAGRPATLRLTVALAANPRPSTLNRPTEGATVPSAVQNTMESSPATATPASEPLSASMGNPLVESGGPVPPTMDCAEMLSTERALHGTEDAIKTMDFHDTWANTLGRIRWVMDALGPAAGVCT